MFCYGSTCFWYHSFADDTQIYVALSPNYFCPADLFFQDGIAAKFLNLTRKKSDTGSNDARSSPYLEFRALTTSTYVKNLGVIIGEDLI